jgi:Flp pilus assembly protein TadB
MAAVSTIERPSAASDTSAALRNLSESALGYATEKASQKIDSWSGQVDEAVASGGVTEGAGYESIKALLGGRNPVLAAIRGGWRGASVKQRGAVILSLVLLLVLAPVTLLLLTLGVLVAGLIAAVRAAAG